MAEPALEVILSGNTGENTAICIVRWISSPGEFLQARVEIKAPVSELPQSGPFQDTPAAEAEVPERVRREAVTRAKQIARAFLEIEI